MNIHIECSVHLSLRTAIWMHHPSKHYQKAILTILNGVSCQSNTLTIYTEIRIHQQTKPQSGNGDVIILLIKTLFNQWNDGCNEIRSHLIQCLSTRFDIHVYTFESCDKTVCANIWINTCVS